jgi:hypothetical protein
VDTVQISHHQLLKKIEEETRKAQQEENGETLYQHFYTIKTLCEVVLDSQLKPAAILQEESPPAGVSETSTLSLSGKKLEIDDGANGDSIFDF